MSFNYFGYGAFLECECDGDNIIVYRNTGEVRKYPTKLKTVLPKQQVEFIGHNIMWYMEDAEHTMYYVGREDGSINGYKIKDNLMCRVSSWKPPQQLMCQDIGSCYDYVNHRLVMDASDMRTCYILGTNDEYVFNEPFHDLVNISAAIALGMRRVPGIHIVGLSGEEVDYVKRGRRIMAHSSWCGDTKRLL